MPYFRSLGQTHGGRIPHGTSNQLLSKQLDEHSRILEELKEQLKGAPDKILEELREELKHLSFSQDAKRSPPFDSLSKILENSGSDKFTNHHYEKYYEKWLEPYRHMSDLSMVEIGANQGESLHAWVNYFTNPRLILGLAYGTLSEGVESKVDVKRIQILRGDQSDPATLKNICDMGPYEIIIDDGSHVPQHMVISFMHLWEKCVKPGGIYIVEDLETNYWHPGSELYGYQLRGTGIGESPATNAVEKFKQLIDVLMRYQLNSKNIMHVLPGDDQICSIEFGMNIMAFKKCTKQEQETHPNEGLDGHSMASVINLKKYFKKARATNPDATMTSL